MTAEPQTEGARLNWRDLWNPAGLLTLSRLPMCIAFPFLAADIRVFLAVYVLALATDILDGWVARRLGHSSHTGSVVDGWLDKMLHINATWTMVNHEWMPGWWMLLWFSREIIQAFMVIWLVPRFYRGQVRAHHASFAGKLTGWTLGTAFIAVLLRQLTGMEVFWTIATVATYATGAAGVWTAGTYLLRDLRDAKARGPLEG